MQATQKEILVHNQRVVCYVINLDRAADRMANMRGRFESLGIAYERIPGVDGMAMSEEEFAGQTSRNRYYKPLRRGEVGCQLGHLKALRRFLETDAAYALIFEDDACFDPEFRTVLAEAIRQREGASDPLLEWDVLKLSHARRRYIALATLGQAHWLVEYGLSVPSTATGAVWTRVAAAGWIRAYKGASRPFDCDLQYPWEYDLTIRSVHPPLVEADGMVTSMGSPTLATRKPWLKLRYEAQRAWPKLRSFGSTYGWWFILPWLWRPRLAYRPRP